MYGQVTSLKNKNLKVMIGLAEINGKGAPFSVVVANESLHQPFIESVESLLVEFGFDGLELDWVWPKCWDEGSVDCSQGPESDRSMLPILVKQLKSAGQAHRWTISMLVSAIPEQVDQAYDVEALAAHLDFFSIRSYTYFVNEPDKAIHSSPLQGSSDDCLNMVSLEERDLLCNKNYVFIKGIFCSVLSNVQYPTGKRRA